MEIKNRQKVLAIAALGALLVLVGDNLILSPLARGWNARAKRIVELKQSIIQGDLLGEREKTIRERWSQMRTNTLPGNPSLAQSLMFKAFDRWAQDSHMKVGSIKPQWKRSDEYTTLECRANAVGNIQALSRFLYDVEKDPLAVKVESVEITSRDNDGQQLSLVLQVSGLLLNQTP